MSAWNTGKDESGNFVDAPECNCPADCTEVVYYPQMSQATLMNGSRVFEKIRGHKQYQQITGALDVATK